MIGLRDDACRLQKAVPKCLGPEVTWGRSVSLPMAMCGMLKNLLASLLLNVTQQRTFTDALRFTLPFATKQRLTLGAINVVDGRNLFTALDTPPVIQSVVYHIISAQI